MPGCADDSAGRRLWGLERLPAGDIVDALVRRRSCAGPGRHCRRGTMARTSVAGLAHPTDPSFVARVPTDCQKSLSSATHIRRPVLIPSPLRSARCPRLDWRRLRRDVRRRAGRACTAERLFEELCGRRRRRSSASIRSRPTPAFLTQGITFTVYGDDQGTERIFPFDLLPRIITAAEWRDARARPDAAAHRHQSVPEGRLSRGPDPRRRRSCRASWCTAAGTTAARCAACTSIATSTCRSPAPTSCGCEDGRFVVLEDNLRVPSGVSYMLANREVTKRVLPGLFDRYHVSPIAHYGQALLATLRALAPPTAPDPTFVVLTPASATPPTSSTRSSRARWAWRSSKGATCSSTTTSSTCGRRPGCGASTSSTGAWTTTFSIRWRFGRIRISAWPGC